MDYWKTLFHGLDFENLQYFKVEGHTVFLKNGYEIEWEGDSLFKLRHDGQTIGPFDDLVEMIEFIKEDMKVNGFS